MELTAQAWVHLLAGDYPISKECVIFTTKFRKSIRIRKDIAQAFFAGFKGVQCKTGEEVTLVPGGDNGTRLVLPDWVIEQLALKSGDTVCITRHGKALTLKKLTLTQWETDIPGFIVVDTFSDHNVERGYTNHSAIDAIQPDDLKAWLALMGTFRVDPLAAFKSMPGPLGFMARKSLLGESTAEDQALSAHYWQEIAQSQQADGSWDGDVMKTASMTIRLLEFNMPVKDPVIQNAMRHGCWRCRNRKVCPGYLCFHKISWSALMPGNPNRVLKGAPIAARAKGNCRRSWTMWILTSIMPMTHVSCG